jgi:DNA invertase Pin-like site-specific DNA recombinase
MTARLKNEGSIYLRRSRTRQETGIHEQLKWGIAEAKKYGVRLDAAPEDLDSMVAHGLQHYKSIYLDDGITGSDLTRPGFVAFRRDALANPRISHFFVHISDRFARPEQAVQAMQMEIELLLAGITFVFENRVSEPRERGLHYFERDILLLYEYTQNGEFLTKLATRVVQTQMHLARQGFRTGGNAPYGFIRVLVDATGQEIMELPSGTTVRREGCHVVIKPHDPAKIQMWLYVLHLYGEKRWGFMRICHHLDELGIPSPNAGQPRRFQGQLRPCSSRWCLRTVAWLIANAAIVGESTYGKKSVGEHRRLGLEGPRNLDDTDRGPDGQAKRIWNLKEKQITVPARYEACADKELFETCQSIREERARCHRGTARCPDPGRYPLATRIHDLTEGCGAVLYGRKYRTKAKYLCSTYMRSGGRDCFPNSVDEEAALRFILEVLQQRIQMCGGREALRARLSQLAAHGQQACSPLGGELELAEQYLGNLEAELKTIGRNLARAKDENIFAIIQAEYKDKEEEVKRARQQVERLRPRQIKFSLPFLKNWMRSSKNLGNSGDSLSSPRLRGYGACASLGKAILTIGQHRNSGVGRVNLDRTKNRVAST